MTMDDEVDGAHSTYATDVGARLRAVRRQKRLSLQAVEASSESEFKASVLGAYERGERAISVPRLERLARLYDVPVEQLLPGDLAPSPSRATSGARDSRANGRVRINLIRLKAVEGVEADALGRFLQTIQVQRGDYNGQVLTIRADDLRVIGATLGLTEDAMTARLEELDLIFHG
jgi:transcriptional regulator with XRE-family HTH domain